MASQANRNRALCAHLMAALCLGAWTAPAWGQGPSPAPTPIVADDKNSTISRPRTFLDYAHFAALGYHGYAIDNLFMINTKGNRDVSLSSQPVANGCHAYDVVTNGTFYRSPKGPVTPIIREGKMDRHDAVDFALNRGAVAVRGDGTIVLGRSEGLSGDDIRVRFGNDILEFTGGGIILVENGIDVTLRNVVFAQYAQNKPSAAQYQPLDWEELVQQKVWPDQCRSGNTASPVPHTIIGIRQGQAYLLVSKAPRSCPRIQSDLGGQGFGTVVMFDGGGATFLNDKDHSLGGGRPGPLFNGSTYTGFGIYLRTNRPNRPRKVDRCAAPNRCGFGAPLSGIGQSLTIKPYAGGVCPMTPPAPLPVDGPSRPARPVILEAGYYVFEKRGLGFRKKHGSVERRSGRHVFLVSVTQSGKGAAEAVGTDAKKLIERWVQEERERSQKACAGRPPLCPCPPDPEIWPTGPAYRVLAGPLPRAEAIARFGCDKTDRSRICIEWEVETRLPYSLLPSQCR